MTATLRAGITEWLSIDNPSGALAGQVNPSRSLTRDGAPATISGKRGNAALFAAGTSDRFRSPADDSWYKMPTAAGSCWAIAFWLRQADYATYRAAACVWGGAGAQQYVNSAFSTGRFEFSHLTASGQVQLATTTNSMSVPNQWHRIVACIQYGVRKSIFIDGVEAASATSGNNILPALAATRILEIAALNSGNYMTGALDEVWWYSHASVPLTQADIVWDYNGGAGRTYAELLGRGRGDDTASPVMAMRLLEGR